MRARCLFDLGLYSSLEKTPVKLVVNAQECPILPNLNKTSRPFTKGMEESTGKRHEAIEYIFESAMPVVPSSGYQYISLVVSITSTRQ